MARLLVALSLLPFYLLGAVPSGYILARLHGIDITRHGSGNIGATNVARIIGARAGLITLALDCAKGFLAAGLAQALSGETWYAALAGTAAVAGHCFSIPRRLPSGKGVAAGFGACLFLCSVPALLGLAVFAAVALSSRLVSLASVSAALSVPVFALLLDLPDAASWASAVIALIIVFRHRENLHRLAMGTERRFEPAGKR